MAKPKAKAKPKVKTHARLFVRFDAKTGELEAGTENFMAFFRSKGFRAGENYQLIETDSNGPYNFPVFSLKQRGRTVVQVEGAYKISEEVKKKKRNPQQFIDYLLREHFDMSL